MSLEAKGTMPFQQTMMAVKIAAQSGQSAGQVYPNSENIRPPLEKEKIRVVEPSTRADVKMDPMEQVKRFYEKQNENLTYAQKYYLREELAAKESLVDITV